MSGHKLCRTMACINVNDSVQDKKNNEGMAHILVDKDQVKVKSRVLALLLT